MEIERAIEVLKEYNNCKAVLTEELEDATDLAIDALEKQVGKKPALQFMSSRGKRCGACEKLIVFSDSYCPNCGQKIDWSDEQ